MSECARFSLHLPFVFTKVREREREFVFNYSNRAASDSSGKCDGYGGTD